MSTEILQIEGLYAGYGSATIIFGAELSVSSGEVLALLGRNGVGKSTLVSTVAGTISATAGSVRLGGRELLGLHASRRFHSGLRVMSQEKPIFDELTVAENLDLVGGTVAAAAELFPFLRDRARQRAGSLSGGEKKMLALARMAQSGGDAWILDEPTEGLQPANVAFSATLVKAAAAAGRAVLLVEQHLHMAMSTADRWSLMEKGIVKPGGDVDETTYETVTRALTV